MMASKDALAPDLATDNKREGSHKKVDGAKRSASSSPTNHDVAKSQAGPAPGSSVKLEQGAEENSDKSTAPRKTSPLPARDSPKSDTSSKAESPTKGDSPNKEFSIRESNFDRGQLKLKITTKRIVKKPANKVTTNKDDSDVSIVGSIGVEQTCFRNLY